jgi:TetR/AcrR family transcriptional repressor of nem operon
MAGRPKIYDEEVALDKAIEVFWKKGYEVASAEELLKAMGIGKGSFYLAYKNGKQELFEKSLQRFFYKHFNAFLNGLKTIDNPVASIKAFYYQMSDESSGPRMNGCYFSNAMVQAEKQEVKMQAGAIMIKISNSFAEALIRAKQKGIINSNISNDILHLYLLNLWSGLNITRQVEKNPKKVKKLIDEHFKLIS